MSIFKSYFETNQLALLFGAALFFIASIYFHLKDKNGFSIAFLMLAGFLIFMFGAMLDPFLNIWDERFHALAAKNLMNHPLMPTLYDDPIVDMPYDRWDRFHIWIHKQPLFLWMIALSFKLFGINELSLRLPDVVLSTLVIFAIYRMGRLTAGTRVGYLAAVLSISNLYLLELLAGRQVLEHNDLIFTMFITFSFWSLIEYRHSKWRGWIVLIGIFSGFAILTKWLVGLLVYLAWASIKVIEKNFSMRKNFDILISLLITILIALPWQILTMLWYPQEAAISNKFNVLHYKIPLDGHAGDFWFHINMIDDFFGVLAPFLVIPAFIALHKSMKDRNLFWSYNVVIITVILFFSFAATKMPSFTFITAALFALAFAALINSLLNFIEKGFKNHRIAKVIIGFVIFLLVIARFDIEFLQERHTLWRVENHYSRTQIHNKKIFQNLNLPPNAVIFNVKGRHYVEAMFYTGLSAYNIIPDSSQVEKLTEKGRVVAIFKTIETKDLTYLQNKNNLIWLNDELMQCD